jgi:SAM-dependent methyltransferase
VSFYSKFADAYETIFPFRQATYDFLVQALSPDRGPVLDLGCGTGGYCGRFAGDGHRVLGVDLDAEMIARAGDRFPDADFATGDIRNVKQFSRSFAAAYCIGNVLAHLTPDDTRAFLDDLHDTLSPEGLWCFQTVNWDRILPGGDYDFPPISAGEALVFQRSYREVTPESLRFQTRLEQDGRKLFAGEVMLHPRTADQYEAAHAAAGFRLVGHYGDFKRSAFAPETSGGSVFVFARD